MAEYSVDGHQGTCAALQLNRSDELILFSFLADHDSAPAVGNVYAQHESLQ